MKRIGRGVSREHGVASNIARVRQRSSRECDPGVRCTRAAQGQEGIADQSGPAQNLAAHRSLPHKVELTAQVVESLGSKRVIAGKAGRRWVGLWNQNSSAPG